MAKTVDLVAVRNALGEIRQVLAEHPEVRERTAAFFAGDPDAQTLADLQEGTHVASYTPLNVRLTTTMVERLDALLPELANSPELATVQKVTRSDALRLCVLRGLDALEREVRKAKK